MLGFAFSKVREAVVWACGGAEMSNLGAFRIFSSFEFYICLNHNVRILSSLLPISSGMKPFVPLGMNIWIRLIWTEWSMREWPLANAT